MTELLEDLSRSFARHLRAEGKSERTTVIYGQSVTFFGRWLVAQTMHIKMLGTVLPRGLIYNLSL